LEQRGHKLELLVEVLVLVLQLALDLFYVFELLLFLEFQQRIVVDLGLARRVFVREARLLLLFVSSS
jgi:hypothetical protein